MAASLPPLGWIVLGDKGFAATQFEDHLAGLGALLVRTLGDQLGLERHGGPHATGRPLYIAVSYLLVSMACLIGAAYTRKVQAAGLDGALRPSMGRQDAAFADWRIGHCSQWAQRWA